MDKPEKIALLQDRCANYKAMNRFHVGDLVTPAAASRLDRKGEPHIVMDNETRRIRCRAKLFAAAHLFICREDNRYYLQGVHIEPLPAGGVLLVATDGRHLVAIRDASGYANRPAICPLPRSMLTAARARRKRPGDDAGDLYLIGQGGYLRNTMVSIAGMPNEWDQAAAFDHQTLAVAYAGEIDGTYPEWRAVMPAAPSEPAAPPAPSFAINPALLVRFCDAAALILRDIGDRRASAAAIEMQVPPPGANPAYLRAQGLDNMVGLVMPVASDHRGFARPDWLGLAAIAKARGQS